MTRTMYDSVSAEAIPKTATIVAGYVDGRYANVGEMRTRFPHARHVSITVLGNTLNAHVADVETGDLTPASGAAWAKRKVAAGQHPTLYCSASAWPAVKAAVHAAGIDARSVSYWIAHYDGIREIPAGAIGKQYIDHGPHGENVDISIVADYWPGVDPAPQPKPPAPAPDPAPTPVPGPTTEVDMFLIEATGDTSVYVVEAKGKRHIGPDEYHVYVAAGLKKVTVTPQQRDAFPNL